jgi:hypothetical protein
MIQGGDLELKPPCGGGVPTLLRGQGWVAKPEYRQQCTHGIHHRPPKERTASHDQNKRLRKSNSEKASHGQTAEKVRTVQKPDNGHTNQNSMP